MSYLANPFKMDIESMAQIRMNTELITVDATRHLPLQTLQSGQLLQLSPKCRGGLILRNAHFAEFVGPGAAVGCSFDIRVTQVFPLGEVQITYPELLADKQKAYQRRRSYMHKHQELIAEPVPLKRASNVYGFLAKLYGTAIVAAIPDDLLAHLGAVLPGTIIMLRQYYTERAHTANPSSVQ